MDKLTQALLKYALSYDELTGVFKWRNPNANRMSVGDVAGGEQHGYIKIKLHSKLYSAHRLAWLYIYGEMPDDEIDHIDGNKSNNAIKNLRDVSHRENMMNMKKARNNKSGLTGVYLRKDNGKLGASIRVDTKIKHLGLFDTLFEAACARKSAEVVYGFHDNHGRSS